MGAMQMSHHHVTLISDSEEEAVGGGWETWIAPPGNQVAGVAGVPVHFNCGSRDGQILVKFWSGPWLLRHTVP